MNLHMTPVLTRSLSSLVALSSALWIGISSFPLTACANSDRPRQVSLSSTGTVLIDRRPFFPLGFYHVSWGVSSKEQIKHLEEIAAAGFNVVHASANDWKSYETFLNRASELGVYILSEHNSDPLEFVNYFKTNPAILAWGMADDVDNGKRDPAEVQALHRKIRTADPNHLTYISGYSKDLQRFVQCANIVGRQSYPIRHHSSAELSSVYPAMAEIRSSMSNPSQQTLFANLQVFPWSVAKPGQIGSVPALSEVRNMTFQSLLAGAKGILYYTYFDETWFLSRQTQLWQGLKTLNLEVQSVAPFLLEGTFRPLTLSSPNLKGGVWTKGQEVLLAIVNTSVQNPQKALVQKSWKQNQGIEPLSGSPSLKPLANGTLEVILPAQAVYLYRMR
jgi:hypothetical protein